jgi:hypothetical protein
MWCDAQFVAFNRSLLLTTNQERDIRSALNDFADFCTRSQGLRCAVIDDPFVHGSLTCRTAVRPLSDGQLDADVMLPFSFQSIPKEFRTPAGVLEWLFRELRESTVYRPRVAKKLVCVRISFVSGLQVDIVPAAVDILEHQPFAIPAVNLKRWDTADPFALRGWLLNLDRLSGGQDRRGDGYVIRSIRYLKRWRDEFLGGRSGMRSILLTAMLGRHSTMRLAEMETSLFPQYQHDAAYLLDTLRLLHKSLLHPNPQTYEHPTNPGESLALKWDKQRFVLFLLKLTECINHLIGGITESSKPRALKEFREAFGNTFPTG